MERRNFGGIIKEVDANEFYSWQVSKIKLGNVVKLRQKCSETLTKSKASGETAGFFQEKTLFNVYPRSNTSDICLKFGKFAVQGFQKTLFVIFSQERVANTVV